ALALQELGFDAKSLLGWQLPIFTDDNCEGARIERIEVDRLHAFFEENIIPVIAGFQGVSSSGGELTTLGRGGSDLTAVALASALGLGVCEIYSDVDGVYDLDPNVFLSARKLPRVSYDVMEQMARRGARVLQEQCISWAKCHGVTILVRATFGRGEGTLINDLEKTMEKKNESVAF